MPLFAFSSNNHFVASSDVTVLHNYELTKSSIHLSSIQKADWKTLATIDTNIKVSNVMSYNGLMFFDGHGRIKGRKALTMLAQHLKELHLLVSPEGYCFQDVSEFGVYSDFGIHYVRLNDFFSCPRHKVELVSISVWSRLELKYNLSKHKKKYVKLEKTVKAKDEELEKLKEKMDDVIQEKEEELQKLKKANEEQQKQAQKKDKELLNLKKNKYKEAVLQKQLKKKDDELWLLKKKDGEEATTIREKNEEFSKLKESDNELRKVLKMKTKDYGLQKLRKEKEEEVSKKEADRDEKSRRNEELRKTNEDMEMKNRVKDEELEKLQNLLKKKSQELEVLEKKDRDKNDEAAKTRKVEGELKEAREKLSSSVTQMKKELEEYQKKLWAIIPAMRQSVPPETFACYFEISFPYVSNSHKLVDNMRVDGNYDVTLVEEEISSAEWPPLPTMRVHIGKGGEDFDKNNWWYLKTSHPEGGFTMLVFYDGYRSQISRYGSYPPIPLPFSKDVEFFSYFSMFSLFNVHPFGTKLCFTYR
ncbi:PLEC [Linum perenne]